MAKLLGWLLRTLEADALVRFSLSYKGCICAAVLLGILSGCGYAPLRMWPVTLGALALAMLLSAKASGPGKNFLVIWLYFAALDANCLSWLNYVMEGFGEMHPALSWTVVLIFSGYLAVPYALLALAAKGLSRGRETAYLCFFLPCALTAADFIIGWLLSGFPWMYFGYTCLEGPFSGFAPLAGVRGISTLFVLCAGCAALGAARHYLYLPVCALIFATGILINGTEYTQAGPGITVSMVQGNIQQSLKWDPQRVQTSIDTYWLNTLPVLGHSKLVIWPETAMPIHSDFLAPLLSQINAEGLSSHTVIATGILRRAEPYSYNSILILGEKVEPGPDFEHYDKRHLVPFGEYVPLEQYLRHLGKIFTMPVSSFKAPEAPPEPLPAAGVLFLPAICYDAIFPEHLASADRPEASGIMMLSNDAWFGTTRGPLEHLDIARMRSMELQKPMLRSTNNGVTAGIDHLGRIIQALPQNETGVLTLDFVPRKGQTPYSRWGNIPLLIFMTLLFLLGLYKARVREPKDKLEQLVR